MTKLELEKTVTALASEVDSIRTALTELKGALSKMEAEEQAKRDRHIRDAAQKFRNRALKFFRNNAAPADTPAAAEYAAAHHFSNLEGMDETALDALIRHHFNDAMANAFSARRMNMPAFHNVLHFLDMLAKVEPLVVTEEMRAAAEKLRAEAAAAAEAAKYLKATSGEFRLRGREELQAFFNEHVVDIVNHNKIYAVLGVPFPKGFILEGPPGCGKTFAVERLAEHLGWHTVHIDSGNIGSTYMHATAKKIEERFEEAEAKAPSILIIDEMDAFMPNRATLPDHDTHCKEEVDSFLKCLQGAEGKRILVVGMTNLITCIDPAVLRTGRMGTHIKVGMPSAQEVQDVLAYALEKRPHAEFNLAPYAEQLLNHPLSDVTHVADEAAMAAARARRERIEEEDLAQAIERLLRRQGAQLPERKPIGFAS